MCRIDKTHLWSVMLVFIFAIGVGFVRQSRDALPSSEALVGKSKQENMVSQATGRLRDHKQRRHIEVYALGIGFTNYLFEVKPLDKNRYLVRAFYWDELPKPSEVRSAEFKLSSRKFDEVVECILKLRKKEGSINAIRLPPIDGGFVIILREGKRVYELNLARIDMALMIGRIRDKEISSNAKKLHKLLFEPLFKIPLGRWQLLPQRDVERLMSLREELINLLFHNANDKQI